MRRSSHSVLLSVVGYVIVSTAFTYLQTNFPGIFNSRVLVTVLAALPIAIVAAGFFYSLPRYCGVIVPPLSEGQPGFSVDGVAAQPFPQGVVYLTRVRNLWLLAVAPLISYALWTAVALHWVAKYDENPLPLYACVAVSSAAFFLAGRWLHERRILHTNCSTLVRVQSVIHSEARYDFFDHRGDRRGGTARFFGRITAGTPAPLVIDLRNPDNSRLYLSFWFHRFEVGQSHHMPPRSASASDSVVG
jgi:hypothetical protein